MSKRSGRGRKNTTCMDPVNNGYFLRGQSSRNCVKSRVLAGKNNIIKKEAKLGFVIKVTMGNPLGCKA